MCESLFMALFCYSLPFYSGEVTCRKKTTKFAYLTGNTVNFRALVRVRTEGNFWISINFPMLGPAIRIVSSLLHFGRTIKYNPPPCKKDPLP